METRANYALIGAFTLAVIAMAFGFVFWFSGAETGQGRQAVRVVFSGSVSGLSRGSSVHFNGIRVGEVKDLGLFPEDPRRVLSTIEIDRTTPIRIDTRARLEFQGLTGVASVALVGGEPASPALKATPGQGLPTIHADRSDFQDLIESARNIARRADEVLERVDRVVAANEAGIGRTIQNVENFSKALNDNSPGINRFLAQMGQAAERVGPLAARLETLATDVSGLVRAIDPQRVARSVDNIEGFTQALADNRQNVSNTLRDIATLADGLKGTPAKLDVALADMSALAKAIDAEKINRVVANADRFAAALGNVSPDVEKTVREARSLVEKLNHSAEKVDGVLKAAEGFLGSAAGEQGKGAFAEVRDAAQAVRLLAENLDRRTADITGGLNRLTASGLREVEALTTEGRRTLGEIGRTVRSLERNPQQVIFGNRPSIPEYNGRR